MRAVILAAGQGTRLRPRIEEMPKCLVPLAGRTLLDRQIAVLRAGSVRDITVVAGYHEEQIALPGITKVVNADYAATNMVFTLFTADVAFDGGDDVVIGYGDIVYEPRVLRALLEVSAPVAVVVDRGWRDYWALRMPDPLADAETMRFDGSRILELGKKPSSYDDIQGQYIGLIRVRASVAARFIEAYRTMDRLVQYDGKPWPQMYMTSFVQHLIDHDWDVRAAFIDHGWLEVDSVADLDRYDAMQADGTLAAFCDLAAFPPSEAR